MFICAICGKLLRPRYPCSSAISVGAILCILRLFSHRFHRFSQMHLEIVLPQIPQIFTDFIYPRIRAPLCYLWEILSHPISVFICDICGSHPLLFEIVLPQIPQIFTDFIYPRIRVHLCYLWEILSHPISVLICDISGSHPCCLRFILPLIPQIFTDFIYPISVLICAICGRFLRTTMGALIPSSTARCGLCADPLPSLSPPRAGVASPRRSGPLRSGRRAVRCAPDRRDVRQRPRSSRMPLCW